MFVRVNIAIVSHVPIEEVVSLLPHVAAYAAVPLWAMCQLVNKEQDGIMPSLYGCHCASGAIGTGQ